MNDRAKFLSTLAIVDALLVASCAHRVATGQGEVEMRGPAGEQAYDFRDDGNDIVRPDPSCCLHPERRFKIGEATPHGIPVEAGLNELGRVTCGLRYVDGSRTSVVLQASRPHDVVFRDAKPLDSACSPCFSELRFGAVLAIETPDGTCSVVGESELRELEPGSGYGFEVGHKGLLFRGLLRGSDTSLTVARVLAGDFQELLAESVGPCTSAGSAAATAAR